RFTQAALFAVEVATFRLLQSWGVRPDLLLGHSIGELAAAHVAGLWSLADAVKVVAARGALMQALPSGGAMVAVAATEDEVIARLVDGVSIAAVNGPLAVVISGDEDAVLAVAAGFDKTRRLRVSHAFHSVLMEPMLREFAAVLQDIDFEMPSLGWVSNVTGEPVGVEVMDPQYWVRQVRQPVRFADGLAAMRAAGVTRFVEVGPSGALATHVDGVCLPTIRKGRDEATSIVQALAVAGPDWVKVFPGARRIELPTYAFQHQRYWPSAPRPVEADTAFWQALEADDLGALGLSGVESVREALPVLAGWRQRVRDSETIDGWRYHVSWTPVVTGAPAAGGRWYVLGTELATVLRDAGLDVTTEPDPDVSGVLADLDDPTDVLALLRELSRAGVTAPLWVSTRGAVSTGRDDVAPDPVGAQVWGLGRVAALEHSDRWGGLIDLPAVLDDRVARLLTAALTGGEDQIAVRGTGVYARRITHAPAAPGGAWSASGTVLITGGTGALGLRVARWVADRGAGHIVLLSRRGAVDDQVAAEFAERGVRLDVVACDITDRAALARVAEGRDIRTAVHAAGSATMLPLAELTSEAYAAAVDAKVIGALNLDAVLGDDLDAFVLFSSIAGVWGGGGQAAYAAGNAALDALALARRARGAVATAIAWGPWADGGMADGAVETDLRRRGLPAMDPERALLALDRALAGDDTAVVVSDVDWSRFAPSFCALRPSPLLRDLPEAAEALRGDEAGDTAVAFRDQLLALGSDDRSRALLDLVRTSAAAVLGHRDPEPVGATVAFRELGFDSLAAVELRNGLRTAIGLVIPTTAVFDHPNPAALAAFLHTLLAGEDTVTDEPVAAAPPAGDPIVIVGMSCRFPGDVHDPEELWRLVVNGTDAITPMPEERGWDLAALYDPDPDVPGTAYVTEGGFVLDADRFDPGFFGISPREALAMDPQQRMLLEVSWEAVERAGIDPLSLRGSRTGVFAGTNGQDYTALFFRSPDSADGHTATGNAASVVSGRLSYTLGLEGPAVTVDTACSSSLVALHLAGQALRSGECTLALAGGVTVMATPGAFVEFSRQRGLAADGRVKAFADGADGTAWGEGAGMLLLERQSDAIANGHPILAVVRGSAVNQDGASNGLTAPNGPAQQRVIRQAVAAAGLTAGQIDVVEGHGTGTTLGDPIEAQALLATYGRDRPADRPLYLGSVKSNIGHTQAAAGVAGIIKMVKALEHGTLPRTLHVDRPSSHVDWASGAVTLLTDQVDWPRTGEPRRAAVSSFGISGTNAHVILEEPPTSPVSPPAERPGLPATPLLLSAKSPAALRDQASRLLDVDADPLDVAWSLATTRSALPYRAVVLDREQLTAGTFETVRADGPVGMLFPGQGAQFAGMGDGLYRAYPTYAAAYDAVTAEFGFGIDAERLDETRFTQAALFAVEVATYRLLESWGVRPDLLLGHSIGELAAAHVAGLWSLADAVKVVAARGALMQALPPGGAMVAIRAGVDEVVPYLTDDVSIAAVNGPQAVVISGDDEAVLAVASRFDKTRRLRVSHAFHSALMEPMLDDFAAVLRTVEFATPTLRWVSDVTGAIAGDEVRTPAYWVRQVRRTVRFADGIATMKQAGITTFLEVGPSGSLAAHVDAPCLPTVRKGRDEARTVVAALAAVDVDWQAFFAGSGAVRVGLPTYPFQRKRYWPAPPLAAPAPAPVAGTPATETAFWDAVERRDLSALTGDLELRADQPLGDALPMLSRWRRRSQVDAWRYGVRWTALRTELTGVPAGRWLLITSDDRPLLADSLRETGAEVTVTDGTDQGILAGHADAVGVLATIGGPEAPAELTALLRDLETAGVTAPLWALTRAAVSTDRTDTPPDPVQAQVWALGRVAGLEMPHRWGGLIDLPEVIDERAAGRIRAVLSGIGEDQVAVRPSGVYARRVVRAQAASGGSWTTRGTTLVTGGTGALGLRVARWAADRGATRVVLLSRRGAAPEGLAEEFRDRGVRLDVHACDVTDRAALTAVADRLAAEGEPVRVVIHAAGVPGIKPLAEIDAVALAAATSAKVTGAVHLDAVFDGAELDAFVLFSSIAGVWGSGGQGAYAAANAALDALAAARRARGAKATAIAWGPWADGGMAADSSAEADLRRRGLPAMAPELALLALEQSLAADDTAVTVADVEWNRFARAFTALRPSPLLVELTDAVEAVHAGEPESADEDVAERLRTRLAELSPGEQDAELQELVRGQVAAVLGFGDPGEVPAGTAFGDLGFDSLMAVELRGKLTAATGLALPAGLAFDYPSVEATARHLRDGLVEDAVTGVSLLSELDKLEAAMVVNAPDELTRAKIAVRVQAFLAKWSQPTATPAGNGSGVLDQLGSASDDEIFTFINDQLGRTD
ncbi:type I polyketide synthase, partial [Actinoplanes sp. DH11]|uniref:type I polyketide synthase n=1 Tax=Actinoplanes sp. DH11 TaxID=2857011 RepID=UPI00210711AD